LFTSLSRKDFKDSLTLQYDYMDAFLDFFIGERSNYKKAREISKHYENYPVLHWRVLFNDMQDKFQEFDGVLNLDQIVIDQENEDAKRKNYMKSKMLEPSYNAMIIGKKVIVEYINTSEVEIRYFKIDPEIWFSSEPFSENDQDNISFTKPVFEMTVTLDQEHPSYTHEV
jgi:hypothetical protein